MAAGTATVTAKYGPGLQATAQVVPGIKGVYLDLSRMVLAIHQENSDPTSKQREYDLTGVATMTVVIAGAVYTLTVS